MKQSIVGGKKGCLQLFRGKFQRDIQKRHKQLQQGTTFHTQKTLTRAIQRQRLHTSQLTCKKFSTEANSHIVRRFHRGNCDGDGGSTSGVTILPHCGAGGGESSLFAAADEERNREAARMVHAREGRVLLVVGGGAAAVSSLEWETWFEGLGSGGKDRSLVSGGGDPLDMRRDIELGFREVSVRLELENHG